MSNLAALLGFFLIKPEVWDQKVQMKEFVIVKSILNIFSSISD